MLDTEIVTFPDFTGWHLGEVRAWMEVHAPGTMLTVVETAPPPRRPPAERKPERRPRQARPELSFGQPRVLRALAGTGSYRLAVAREQLPEADPTPAAVIS